MFNRNESLEQELYRRAKKRVNIKRSFKIHRNVYIVTNLCLTSMLGIIGFSEGVLGETMLASSITALSWGIGLGIHFVCAGSALKALDIDNEIEREVQYLKERAGMDFINEPLKTDVYNMKNTSKEKNLDKRV